MTCVQLTIDSPNILVVFVIFVFYRASIISETEISRCENVSMRLELDALRKEMILATESHTATLAVEVSARQKAERDRDMLESRLLLVLSSVGQVDL